VNCWQAGLELAVGPLRSLGESVLRQFVREFSKTVQRKFVLIENHPKEQITIAFAINNLKLINMFRQASVSFKSAVDAPDGN
jgi:hypothetical protein